MVKESDKKAIKRDTESEKGGVCFNVPLRVKDWTRFVALRGKLLHAVYYSIKKKKKKKYNYFFFFFF